MERLLGMAAPSTKFILMNSDGVWQPVDDPRSVGESIVIFLLRCLVPPHVDNEAAAALLASQTQTDQWVGIRPTNLVDAPESTSSYVFHDKAIGGLFGSSVVSRANVAQSMVDILTDDKLFAKYKQKFPVVHNAVQTK